MTLEQAKQELVKRYLYLYENSCFILAPFMYGQTQEEFRKSNQSYDFDAPLSYLNIGILDKINSVFEEFLLSDKIIEDTVLYKMIESQRNDYEYLERVKRGIALLEKDNTGEDYYKTVLDIGKILNTTGSYIKEQSGDLKNKERKLRVLDEYCKIARYQNNSKIFGSGRNSNLNDCSSFTISTYKNEPFLRDKQDIGITKNSFITTIENALCYEDNQSIFTENEKLKIYLDYHDELPRDLEITCGIEEEYIPLMIETRLYRPENTSPCGENFIIREEEIFVNPNDTLYRYYQICPHCGFIVNIPKEILSDSIKQRIEDRCSTDEKLFRKMFLYSELFSLDKNSNQIQKTLFKNFFKH